MTVTPQSRHLVAELDESYSIVGKDRGFCVMELLCSVICLATALMPPAKQKTHIR